jgi:hypothetical protein
MVLRAAPLPVPVVKHKAGVRNQAAHRINLRLELESERRERRNISRCTLSFHICYWANNGLSSLPRSVWLLGPE